MENWESAVWMGVDDPWGWCVANVGNRLKTGWWCLLTTIPGKFGAFLKTKNYSSIARLLTTRSTTCDRASELLSSSYPWVTQHPTCWKREDTWKCYISTYCMSSAWLTRCSGCEKRRARCSRRFITWCIQKLKHLWKPRHASKFRLINSLIWCFCHRLSPPYVVHEWKLLRFTAETSSTWIRLYVLYVSSLKQRPF